MATTDLLVSKGRLAWCLYIDLVALDHSGNIWDAALAAMLAALETVSLPAASVDPDTGEISVDPTSRTAIQAPTLQILGVVLGSSHCSHLTPIGPYAIKTLTLYVH